MSTSDLFGQGRVCVEDDGLRFVLEEHWSEAPVLGVIGMNPSHADAERNDMTWSRWTGFANRWGFGGLAAINLAPWRDPDPKPVLARLRNLKLKGDQESRAHIDRNLDEIENLACRAERAPRAWLCSWGEGGAGFDQAYPLKAQLLDAIGMARRAPCFIALAATASGAPTHVMARGLHRIPDDAEPRLFSPANGLLGPPIKLATLLELCNV